MITQIQRSSSSPFAHSQHGFGQSQYPLLLYRRLTKHISSMTNRTISSHPSPQVAQPNPSYRSFLTPISRLQAWHCEDRRRVRQAGCRGRKSRALESQSRHRPRCTHWKHQPSQGTPVRSRRPSSGTRMQRVFVRSLSSALNSTRPRSLQARSSLSTSRIKRSLRISRRIRSPSRKVSSTSVYRLPRRRHPSHVSSVCASRSKSTTQSSRCVSSFTWNSCMCSRDLLGCPLYPSREEGRHCW